MKPIVLIVDDDEETLKLFHLWLDSEYMVRTAKDGVDALVSAKAVRPDIVVVDYLMPIMNGLQFLREMRASEGLKFVPAILVTGSFVGLGRNMEIEEARRLANDFLFKPILRRQMLDAVRRVLRGPG